MQGNPGLPNNVLDNKVQTLVHKHTHVMCVCPRVHACVHTYVHSQTWGWTHTHISDIQEETSSQEDL